MTVSLVRHLNRLRLSSCAAPASQGHASVLSGRHSNTREVRTIEEVTALVRILYDRQLQCPRLWYPLENAAAQPCLVSSVDVGK